eukprot:1701011-Heterocapsa_arctica.AAC.1
MLAHVPFAAWCGDCVAGRGRDSPHRKVEPHGGHPIVELDYVFLKSGLEADTLLAVLIGYLKLLGYGFAFPSR